MSGGPPPPPPGGPPPPPGWKGDPLPPSGSPKPPEVDVGSTVGDAFRMFRRYPSLFPLLAVVVVVPYSTAIYIWTGAGPYSTQAMSPVEQVTVGVLGWLLLGPLITALHTHAVAKIRDGEEPDFGEVFKLGLRALPTVTAAVIMSGLGIFLGILALIVPGVILLLRWFVVAQAAALGDEGWLGALRTSRKLTAGHYKEIFIFILLVYILAAIPAAIGSVAFADDTSFGAFAAGTLIQLVTVAFTALATSIFYFKLVEVHEALPPEAKPASS